MTSMSTVHPQRPADAAERTAGARSETGASTPTTGVPRGRSAARPGPTGPVSTGGRDVYGARSRSASAPLAGAA
ncbi:hypothetical protein FTX61_14690 [Nitriliruptoraceae bacterium ZYF776]|nr:hypothetical protein [Profundirhabdus halotolerans]